MVERLNMRVFRRRTVGGRLKGHFVRSAVFASLLYGLEHCALGARDRRRLDGYFIRLAKRVLQLRYNYHLSYEEAEQRLGVERPSQQLARNRLRWIGHALRSDDIVLREVLTFVPESGARRRGRPRLRFYDTLKADLADRKLSYQHTVKTTSGIYCRRRLPTAPTGRRSSSGDAKMDATFSSILSGLVI